MDIKLFLQFIETLLEGATFFGVKILSFYTSSNTKITLEARSERIYFHFYNDDRPQNTVSLNFDFKDVKPLLQKITNLNDLAAFSPEYQKNLIHLTQDIAYIDKFLRTTDLSLQFEKDKELLSLKLKNDDRLYELRLGQLYSPKPAKVSLTTISSVRVSVYSSQLKTMNQSNYFAFDYMIEPWDIPLALSSVLVLDAGSSTLEEFSSQIKQVDPSLGATLLALQLNNGLAHKGIVKAVKI